MSDERLYGVPGAEELFDDIAGAYESQIDPWVDSEPPDRSWQIEEWTVRPHLDHVPDPYWLVDYLVERMADDDLGWEGVDWDRFEKQVAEDPAVKDALNALRHAVAAKVTWRMADKHVATHTITWDDHGEPLVDGEPMYVKAPCPTAAQPEPRNSSDRADQ